MISVVIPTITGRESWLRRSVQAYHQTTPNVEIIVIANEPSCGHAWIEGCKRSTGRYVHFTADDITPKESWWGQAVGSCDRGAVPLANVRTPGGAPAWCNSPLGDMGLVRNVLVPFLSREQLALGGWLLPIHYGSDDWVSYRAVQLGLPLDECPAYVLTHHVAAEGRTYMRRHGDVKTLAEAMRAAGYLPPVYEQLEKNLRVSETGLDNVRISDLDGHARRQMRMQQRDFWMQQGIPIVGP